MDEARAGFGTAVALVGEPGVGKTTLVQRLGIYADAAGFAVFIGRGSEFERDVPFGLMIDALNEPLGGAWPTASRGPGAGVAAEVGAVMPVFAAGAGAARGGLDAECCRPEAAVCALLDHLVRERPLLLALDDVHWADPASVELISHLLRRPLRRCLLALAYRRRGASSRLLAAIDAVTRSGTLHPLELAPLTVDEADEMLGHRLARSRLLALHTESGGNPFYLEQLARVERRPQRGALPADFAAGPEPHVPFAVRASIARELSGLTPAHRRLLEAAAVAGDPFDFDVAAEIANLDEAAALAGLDRLVATELVRETEVPRRLRFRHPIVRRTVYDDAQAGWRLAAHRRAARSLAARGAPIGALAHHVEHSARVGDEHAAELLEDAGYAAASRAPGAAARWFGAALRIVPSNAPTEKRLQLLTSLAAALAATGRLQESGEVLSRALELVPPSMPEAHARVTGMIARTEQGLGRPEPARRLLAGALAGVHPSGADAAALHLELSDNHFMAGEWDTARDEARATFDLARSVGAQALELAAIVQFGWIAEAVGAIGEARVRSAEAARRIDSFADAELTPQLLEALLTLGYTETMIDRLAEAAQHLERGERVCRATGHGHLLAGFLFGHAGTRLLQGRLAEARSAAAAAAEASLQLDNEQSLAGAQALRCWTASLQGDAGTALAAGELAMQAAERAPGSTFAWLPKVCYGEALIEFGQRNLGQSTIMAAGGRQLAHVQPSSRAHWWRVLVECDVLDGLLDAAAALVEQLEPLADSLGLRSRQGEALLARAHVQLARDDWQNAARSALKAVERFEGTGYVLEAARSRMVAARALERSGEVARCARELEASHAALRACGALRLADEAAKQLRRLGRAVIRAGTPTSGNPPSINGLTARELEVADRVSRGYRNREIADELFISEKTVEKHLSRVFAKLGVSSRASVAATIARQQAANER